MSSVVNLAWIILTTEDTESTEVAQSWFPLVILKDSQQTRAQAAAVIARGGVIAFRTDTFYGLGADPFNRAAVKRIRELKGREEIKPLLVVISDSHQVERLIQEKSQEFDLLAERFWPGPLTLIGRGCNLVPEEVTAGTGTIGVRLPDDREVRSLVLACGGALTATSANPSGREPAKTASEVWDYFGDQLDLIIDGGSARAERPSTVVDVTGGAPRLIREGVIPWHDIQDVTHP